MDNLEFLIDKGLLLKGKQPVKLKGTNQIVKNGVIFQQYCNNGLRYDIAVSWLQKSIRMGYLDQAMYCAYHILDLGKLFCSHLLNRLIIITSEDIGPAEPNLPTYISKLYIECKSTDVPPDRLRENIIIMITMLCHARKSRIADWLIHEYTSCKIYDPDSRNGLIAVAVDMCSNHLVDRSRCRLTYVDNNGELKVMDKSLLVYNIWQYIIDETMGDSSYSDIISLLTLFMMRGPEYGLLHLVHAIIIMFDNIPEIDGAISEIYNDRVISKTWDEIGTSNFPILNRAVDMHTHYGRKHLGRGMYDFLHYGSCLQKEKWTPFNEEIKIIDGLKRKYDLPKVDCSQPRSYQSSIVNKCVDSLVSKGQEWIVMACGTGKTKTSYWVHEKMQDLKDINITVIVLPFLEILKQFFECWSAMNRSKKIAYTTGILASCNDSFSKCKYSNYEYLTDGRSMDMFLKLNGKKLIFTTYQSVGKLISWNLPVDMVIYDEAHHINSRTMFKRGIHLYLTATPKIQGVGITYHIKDAIKDGHLTDYRVHVLPSVSNEMDYMDYIMKRNNKTIVYCSLTASAKQLYYDYMNRIDGSGDDIKPYYVDCKSNQDSRALIYKNFRHSRKSVIFNCAILGEGVDIPECDSIFIHSGYTSSSSVVQAVGRPLRLYPDKSIANIYMISDLNTSKRLNGIRVYDDDIDDKTDVVEDMMA